MKAYQQLLRRVLKFGEPHNDRTGVGTTSLFGEQIVFNMWEGFPLVTTREIPFRWVAEELFWQLKGSTDEAELSEKGVHSWGKWATGEVCAKYGREAGDLGPTYGFQLRQFGGPSHLSTQGRRQLYPLMLPQERGWDQLQTLCYRLDVDPFSRRHVVTLWDPITVDTVEPPPCYPLFQFKVHADPHVEGLSLSVYQRSADAFVGLAFDIAHFALLLELVAFYTGRQPRRLIISLGDVHIYNTHRVAVGELLAREPRERPRLVIRKQMIHGQPGTPGADTFVNLLQTTWDDLELLNYNPWPKLSVPVAV